MARSSPLVALRGNSARPQVALTLLPSPDMVRRMALVQSTSDLDPIVLPATATLKAARLLALLDAMGIHRLDEPVGALGLETLQAAARAAAAHGLGRQIPMILSAPSLDAEGITLAIDQLAEGLEDSPVPEVEIVELARVFGWDELSAIVDASPVSLRRYASGQREAPDDVAHQVHWLAKVIGDLRGAYNDAGIRRWFARSRVQLGHRAPRQLLVGGRWRPEHERVMRIRGLAQALAGGAAT